MNSKYEGRFRGLVTFAFIAAACAITYVGIRSLGMGRYNEALSSAKDSVPTVREFVDLFPHSTHLISYYDGRVATPTWSSTVGLYGRYVLHLQFEVKLNKSRTRIISHAPPRFILEEIADVQISSDGRYESVTPGDAYLTFGSAEWDKVVKANGDLAALGLTVKRTQPVPRFESLWRRGTGEELPSDR